MKKVEIAWNNINSPGPLNREQWKGEKEKLKINKSGYKIQKKMSGE